MFRRAPALLLALLFGCGEATGPTIKDTVDDEVGAAEPGVRLLLGLPYLEVEQGRDAWLTAYASRWGGYTGTVAVTPRSAPPGVEIQAAVVPFLVDSARIRFRVGVAADTGHSKITFLASAGAVIRDSATFELRVVPRKRNN